MKFIISLFIFLLAALPAVALAQAGPTATLQLDKFRRYAYVTFSDIKNVSRINYTLVYDTSSGQKGLPAGRQGLEGGFKNRSSRKSTRRQILGTCSSGRCVYHKNIKNISLDATFTLRSGGTVNVTRALP